MADLWRGIGAAQRSLPGLRPGARRGGIAGLLVNASPMVEALALDFALEDPPNAGTAAVTIDAAATGAGVVAQSGAGAGTITATVAGAGSIRQNGAGAGTISASGAASGQAGQSGAASGAISASLSASAGVSISGAGSATAAASGAATGAAEVLGSGSGSVSVTVAGAGDAVVASDPAVRLDGRIRSVIVSGGYGPTFIEDRLGGAVSGAPVTRIAGRISPAFIKGKAA